MVFCLQDDVIGVYLDICVLMMFCLVGLDTH